MIADIRHFYCYKPNPVQIPVYTLIHDKRKYAKHTFNCREELRGKLQSDNSYQRSLGVMLIAENVQWDTEHKMRDTLPEYLEILHDEKMVTVRQCIQALGLIVQKEPAYNKDITEALLAFDIMSVRETMRKLILLDIIHTLIEIRKNYDCSEISNYIFSALSGEILDGKSKKPSKSCCNCSFINVIYWLIYQSDIAIMKEYYVGLKGEATNEV